MKKDKLWIGIVMILLASVFSCTGQLLWKLATGNGSITWLLGGAVLYGCGAVLMIVSFRFGELSVLHPMLSFGYALSIVLGAVVLKETVTSGKIAGVAIIIVGMVFLGLSGRKEINK